MPDAQRCQHHYLGVALVTPESRPRRECKSRRPRSWHQIAAMLSISGLGRLARVYMHEVDVVIIGAGAAGVAAASRLAATPICALVLEARGRIGGRAWTTHACGFPLDLGCGWLHSADENEWSTIAKKLGFEIDVVDGARSRHRSAIE